MSTKTLKNSSKTATSLGCVPCVCGRRFMTASTRYLCVVVVTRCKFATQTGCRNTTDVRGGKRARHVAANINILIYLPVIRSAFKHTRTHPSNATAEVFQPLTSSRHAPCDCFPRNHRGSGPFRKCPKLPLLYNFLQHLQSVHHSTSMVLQL